MSFAIAYRMLGSVAEAEDVVQEALLRVHRALEAGERIESPRAFVATITTRLAIDELRSARARRERYVGEWLPEPILTDSRDDPAQHAEIADSLSMAMLVLLETLSPEQRAVLLLRDVFDYGYGEIARIVGKSEDNVRQLATRARAHVDAGRPRFQTSREQRDELARRFFAAATEGDLAGLEALLAHDVVLTGDGGGKVPALGRPLQGRTPRRAHAGELGQARRPDPGRVAAPGRGQRDAGRAAARRRGPAGRRLGARDRRRPDPGRQLGRQSRQARPPRTSLRSRRRTASCSARLIGWVPARFVKEVSPATQAPVSQLASSRTQSKR